jgi:hypothetical protein
MGCSVTILAVGDALAVVTSVLGLGVASALLLIVELEASETAVFLIGLILALALAITLRSFWHALGITSLAGELRVFVAAA